MSQTSYRTALPCITKSGGDLPRADRTLIDPHRNSKPRSVARWGQAASRGLRRDQVAREGRIFVRIYKLAVTVAYAESRLIHPSACRTYFTPIKDSGNSAFSVLGVPTGEILAALSMVEVAGYCPPRPNTFCHSRITTVLSSIATVSGQSSSWSICRRCRPPNPRTGEQDRSLARAGRACAPTTVPPTTTSRRGTATGPQ